MTGRTHASIGANAVWITAAVGMVGDWSIPFMAIGAVAALLPDIDAAHAKIHYLGGGVLNAWKGAFKHRGFFHSLLAVFFVFTITTIFLTRHHVLLSSIITIGYASHLLIDGFTASGMQYLFPLKKNYRLVPKKCVVPIGGFFDQFLFVLGLMGVLFFILTQYL